LFVGYGIAGNRAAAIDSWSSPVICSARDPPRDRAKMAELAREYHDTHDPEIPEEIYELARRIKGRWSILRGALHDDFPLY
jgi:hypothetical protein